MPLLKKKNRFSLKMNWMKIRNLKKKKNLKKELEKRLPLVCRAR